MKRNVAVKCGLLCVLFAAGCVPIQFEIANIEGEFSPMEAGLEPGEMFDDVEVRVPILALDLSEMIEQARMELGIPVNLQSLIVNRIEFDAQSGSNFDFIESIELSFLPDGEDFADRTVLITEMAPAGGFGDMVDLELMTEFDILPFVTEGGTGNAGELILVISGTAPDDAQSWLSTLVVTAIVGFGS